MRKGLLVILVLTLVAALFLGGCGDNGNDDTEITLYHPTGRYPQDAAVAEAVQAMLADVGLTVNLETLDWGTYLDTVIVPPEEAEHDIFMLGWGTMTLDADYGLYALFHSSQFPPSNNVSYYDNEEVDALLDEARVTADRAEREALYHEAINIIWEDAPWIFLYDEGQVNGVRDNVRGLIHHPLENLSAWDAWIEDEDQDLIIAIGAEAENLDPITMMSSPAATISEHMAETLIYLDVDGTLQPQLATSWEPSEDDMYWDLTLREGVEFHDGTPFNAEAVKVNLDRFMADAPFAFLLGEVSEVEVVEEYLVRIHLERPFAPIASHLSHSFIAMHSPASLEALDEGEFVEGPVGTGPFVFDGWDRGQQIKMVRNDNYWGDAPQLDTVTFRFIPDEGSRVVALETGEVHAIMAVPPSEIARLQDVDGVDIVEETSVRVIYLGFNQDLELFQDVRVRQALNYAVDKEAIVNTIFEGVGSPSTAPIVPAIFGYNEVGPYEYNPERARELLIEAGVISE